MATATGDGQNVEAAEDQYESFRNCLAKSKSGASCVGELPEDSVYKNILASPLSDHITMDKYIPMESPKWVWGGLGLPGPAAYLPSALAYPSSPFDSQ